MQTDKSKGVREVSPVDALIDSVEAVYLVFGYISEFNVLKYIATGADSLAKILMPVRSLISGFQVFGFGNKLSAQPFGRRFKVCGLVSQTVHTFL